MLKPLAGAVIVSMLALAACSHGSDEVRDGRDLVIKDSPDGRFRAQLREVNIDGSIMVSQPYQVVLTSLVHGSLKPMVILVADNTPPLELAWEPPATLLVCYSEAHIYGFRNVFESAVQGDTNLYRADVVLRKVGASGPCTG